MLEPHPPDLEGLTWRSIAPVDLEAVKELADRCLVVDGGLVFINDPEHLQARFFPDTPGAAIGAYLPDRRLGACVAVHRTADKAGATISGLVLPELRGLGIGSYLMAWSQAQAKGLCADIPENPQFLRIRTESLTEPEHRLYQALGFSCVFEELVMRRNLDPSLPETSLPNDVALQNWQTGLAEEFYAAYVPAFRDRPGFPGWSASEWIAGVMEDDMRPEWTLLAQADGVPAGFILGTIVLSSNPHGGYISQVGVVPAQRRRGLASGLMIESMRRMQAAGIPWCLLCVNLNNPGAIRAYQKLGFETIGRRARYERATGERARRERARNERLV